MAPLRCTCRIMEGFPERSRVNGEECPHGHSECGRMTALVRQLMTQNRGKCLDARRLFFTERHSGRDERMLERLEGDFRLNSEVAARAFMYDRHVGINGKCAVPCVADVKCAERLCCMAGGRYGNVQGQHERPGNSDQQKCALHLHDLQFYFSMFLPVNIKMELRDNRIHAASDGGMAACLARERSDNAGSLRLLMAGVPQCR